jgi:hypothetical protein
MCAEERVSSRAGGVPAVKPASRTPAVLPRKCLFKNPTRKKQIINMLPAIEKPFGILYKHRGPVPQGGNFRQAIATRVLSAFGAQI